jgi:hypothetical protein
VPSPSPTRGISAGGRGTRGDTFAGMTFGGGVVALVEDTVEARKP